MPLSFYELQRRPIIYHVQLQLYQRPVRGGYVLLYTYEPWERRASLSIRLRIFRRIAWGAPARTILPLRCRLTAGSRRSQPSCNSAT